MHCFGQLIYESGSYAAPLPDDFQEWESVTDATNSLAGTWNDMDVDPAEGQGVTLLLWLGKPDPEAPFPCDGANFPHDRTYQLGPRCGVQRLE
ncbi:hypothetical protein VRRI112168_02685 [Vreelandella rituensis]|uniref:Uncharacterized protein n=1 Tax=Vreelandella rituensis TaxID=2282306 RepID=A0A368U9R3_9GAMM|nr:hypothetical protein [Halomonas rituensis]RCV93651.1 hypothetical protein DU506_00405 [Halomonas rituensis]